jgi:hypothetical protein
MGHLMRFLVLVTFLAATCAASGDLWAQRGRGGGGGGGWHDGGFKGGGFQAGGKTGGGGQNNVNRQGEKFDRGFHAQGNGGSFSGGGPIDQATQFRGGQPQEMQLRNEQRKLEHRRQIADHLREISERNGNQQLQDVADRFEAQAQEHYDKRLEKLNGLNETLGDEASGVAGDAPGGDDGFGDAASTSNQFADAARNADAARKLTGRENALQRQLRNEERILNQRMEAAERLRQLAAQSGDLQLLEAAERLESTALSHYEQRLTKISEFQQRFNPSDPGGASTR